MQKRFKIVSHVIRGRSHYKNDLPVQDKIYYIMKRKAGGISLSDGAGSVKLSQIGAELLTKEVLLFVHKHYSKLIQLDQKTISSNIHTALFRKIVKKAKKLKVNINELSSTLLFVYVRNNKYIAGHIGDGVIGYLDNQDLKVLSLPENGEFANTTYFLTSKRAKEHFRIYKGDIENIEGFILMSDGAASLLYSKNKNELANAVRKFINWLKNGNEIIVKKKLIEIEKYFFEATDDDCSVILLRNN